MCDNGMEQLKSPSNSFLIHKIVKQKRGTADIQLRCHRGVWKPLNIIGGSCHKYHFWVLSWQIRVCCDKTRLLSWQNIFCDDKTFVVTNICHNKHNFVVTKVLSWRTWFFWQQKTCFVTTNMCLLQRKYACCDKTFVATKLCLLQQNYVCHDKNDTYGREPPMIPQDP